MLVVLEFQFGNAGDRTVSGTGDFLKPSQLGIMQGIWGTKIFLCPTALHASIYAPCCGPAIDDA
jgi:hypothetical protein